MLFSNNKKIKEFFNKPISNTFAMVREKDNYYHKTIPINKAYTWKMKNYTIRKSEDPNKE